jgi:hypothetical protein
LKCILRIGQAPRRGGEILACIKVTRVEEPAPVEGAAIGNLKINDRAPSCFASNKLALRNRRRKASLQDRPLPVRAEYTVGDIAHATGTLEKQ